MSFLILSTLINAVKKNGLSGCIFSTNFDCSSAKRVHISEMVGLQFLPFDLLIELLTSKRVTFCQWVGRSRLEVKCIFQRPTLVDLPSNEVQNSLPITHAPTVLFRNLRVCEDLGLNSILSVSHFKTA